MGKFSIQDVRSAGRASLTLCALSLLAWACSASAAEENPFKKAQVGDWAEYKQSTEMAQGKMESTLKQTVTAKDEKSITLKVQMTANGNAMPAQDIKIPLDQPYDPYQSQQGAKMEKIKEGDETISVGGKDYKSHWVQAKVTVEAQGMKVESETKSWISPDAPLGGLVKMETSAMGAKVCMELTGSGAGK